MSPVDVGRQTDGSRWEPMDGSGEVELTSTGLSEHHDIVFTIYDHGELGKYIEFRSYMACWDNLVSRTSIAEIVTPQILSTQGSSQTIPPSSSDLTSLQVRSTESKAQYVVSFDGEGRCLRYKAFSFCKDFRRLSNALQARNSTPIRAECHLVVVDCDYIRR